MKLIGYYKLLLFKFSKSINFIGTCSLLSPNGIVLFPFNHSKMFHLILLSQPIKRIYDLFNSKLLRQKFWFFFDGLNELKLS